MTSNPKFEVIFTRPVISHLQEIDRKYHSLIRATIDEQLTNEPESETINRKPLRPPFLLDATWELRFGPNNRFRVLYDINYDTYQVYILAIGIKVGSQLFIGKEVIEQ